MLSRPIRPLFFTKTSEGRESMPSPPPHYPSKRTVFLWMEALENNTALLG
jgi:hypothetical protein